MIENMDPTLYILITLCLLSFICFSSVAALFWWNASRYRARIRQLEQEIDELRKLYRAVTNNPKTRRPQ